MACALGGSDPQIVPFVTFILAMVCSMGTGTSWGTMAIMFPAAIPLCITLSRDLGYDDGSDFTTRVILSCSAAVLGGSVWGDHCSIVSDTTVLAAAACECNVRNRDSNHSPNSNPNPKPTTKPSVSATCATDIRTLTLTLSRL